MRNTSFYQITIIAAVAAGFTTFHFTAMAQDEKPAKTTTDGGAEMTLEERMGYAYGVSVAVQLKNRGRPPMDTAAFKQGMDDVMADNEMQMSPNEMKNVLSLATIIMRAHGEKAQEDTAEGAGKENLEAGKKHHEENSKKEGIETTITGLQYEVLERGDGESPAGPDANVTVHYTGTLLDGTKFDSSRDRGQPSSFPLSNVIPGWTEGVQLMKEGDRFKFHIPYYLAYGAAGKGATIPQFSTLIFDIELIDAGGEEEK